MVLNESGEVVQCFSYMSGRFSWNTNIAVRTLTSLLSTAVSSDVDKDFLGGSGYTKILNVSQQAKGKMNEWII